VLTELPEDYRRFERTSDLQELIVLMGSFACLGRPRRCPPCPTSPWVILADVMVDAAGAVQVDCAAHRRYVVSFGDYFFRCSGKLSESQGFFPQLGMKQS